MAATAAVNGSADVPDLTPPTHVAAALRVRPDPLVTGDASFQRHLDGLCGDDVTLSDARPPKEVLAEIEQQWLAIYEAYIDDADSVRASPLHLPRLQWLHMR